MDFREVHLVRIGAVELDVKAHNRHGEIIARFMPRGSAEELFLDHGASGNCPGRVRGNPSGPA
jgi:hypothetical protein